MTNFIRVGKAVPLNAEGHEGRQDMKAHVMEGIVCRPENPPDVPAPGTRAESGFRGSGCHGAYRLPAAEISAVVSHGTGVQASIHEDPIEPSLQDGRMAVPPDRELEHDQVRALQSPDLPLDIHGQRFGCKCISLLTQGRENGGIRAVSVVIGMFTGIEPLAVQIGSLDSMTQLPQGGLGYLLERRIERRRFRMAMNNQRMQKEFPR